MIKVSVFYPNDEGRRFDIDYYCTKHMLLIQETVGTALRGVAVEQGLNDTTPGARAPYVAMGHLYFDSLEVFQRDYAPHRETFRKDIPNFTDIQPIIQISEVKIR